VAILRVAQMGHPVLRMIAKPVNLEAIQLPDFQSFCEDMLDTMDEYDGAGLAAPQVHQSIRVVLLTLDTSRGAEFLINPEIEILTEKTTRSFEGCLSVDSLRAAVDRPGHIRLRAHGRDGLLKDLELTGFPAIVAQHECDHLDGVLYVDRCDPRTLSFLPEYRRFGPIDDWDLDTGDLRDELPQQGVAFADKIIVHNAGV
jgi:peptide deformylase